MIVSSKRYKNLMEKYGIVLDRLTDKIHERDRLAAENADLRKHLNEANDLAVRLGNENADLRGRLDPDALTICYMSGQATGDAEARAMAKRLRAANATLDALREAVPEDACIGEWEYGELSECLHEIQSKLYPQPTEPTP